MILDWLKDKKNTSYFSFEKNKGMSTALLEGFKLIDKEYKSKRFSGDDLVITIDGDGQHDPLEIIGMYTYFVNNNLDILIAKRDLSNYPVYRVIGNKLISFINSLIGKFKFSDIESGFKMLKVAFVPSLLTYYSGFRYSCASEIAIIASLLKYKIDNSYTVRIPYYRKRVGCPGAIDFFINIASSLVAVLKIRINKMA